MFSFSSNYRLKDIIPSNYIDIHNHILPNIDDGAPNLVHSDRLITAIKKMNIFKAIATPHTYLGQWNNTPITIENAFKLTIENNENFKFLKGFASEYMLNQELIDLAKKERLLCLHENYLLIEIPSRRMQLNLNEMLFELQLLNYKLILAHPERYVYLCEDLTELKKIKSFGIFFQLNLLSLTGYYGNTVTKNAVHLLDNNMYDFSGTDIHNEQQVDNLCNSRIKYTNKKKLIELLKKNSIFSN